ncbi:MAG: hypothetical protein VX278_01285 [Myxococcota bacterium]|nr:hypothetical protein [Myxococcota bacterium]
MFWIFAAFAHATVLPHNDDIDRSGIVFIAQIEEPNAFIKLGSKSVLLKDDGVSPDKEAQDGVTAGFFEANREKSYNLRLMSAQDKLLWTGEVTSIPQHQVWVWIRHPRGAPMDVKIEYKKLLNATHKTSMLSFDAAQGDLYMRFGIAVLFFLFGWLIRIKKPSQIRRKGKPFAHPTLKNPIGIQQVWLVPPQNRLPVLLDALTAFTPSMNVLLLLDPETPAEDRSAAESMPGVFVLSKVPTENHLVLQEYKNLSAMGPVLLIIAERRALEPPVNQEQPNQVVIDLLQTDCSILFLCAEKPAALPKSVHVKNTEEHGQE